MNPQPTTPTGKYGSPDIGYFDTYDAALSALSAKAGGTTSNTAGTVANVGTTKTPSIPSPYGDVSGANAAVAGITQLIESQQKQAEDQRAVDEKNQASYLKQSNSLLSSLTGVRKDAETLTGIDPAKYFDDEKSQIAAIGSLNEQYNEVNRVKEEALANASGRNQSKNSYNNETAQIERNYAPRLNELSANINARVAVLTASQGRFQEAQNYISQAVQDATSITRFKFDSFNQFVQMNEASISRLDTKYQNILNQSVELVKTKWQQDVEDKKAVGTLMLGNPNAGVLITDSYDEAVAKVQGAGGDVMTNLEIQAKKATIAATNRSNQDGGGGGTSGFKDSKVESSIREDAVSLLADIDAGTLTLEKAYSKLRTLYSPSEVSDEALKSLLGMASSASTGTSSTSSSTPVYGKGNYSKVDIQTRAQELSDMGYTSVQMKNALIQNGYDRNQATAVANSFGNIIDDFTNVISNYLFNE